MKKWLFLIFCVLFFTLGVISPTNYAQISRKAALHLGRTDAVRWYYDGRMP